MEESGPSELLSRASLLALRRAGARDQEGPLCSLPKCPLHTAQRRWISPASAGGARRRVRGCREASERALRPGPLGWELSLRRMGQDLRGTIRDEEGWTGEVPRPSLAA